MIPRITRGGSAYGALHYDHGPGRRDEHKNAHKVAGTVGGRTWKERAHAIDEHIKNTRPDITKPIVRTSLRLAQEDRKLTDKEWRQVAERYADKMGFKDCPWEAVRHADDHIHLTISRITWDGKVIDQRDNYKNAQTVVRGIEKKHELINAAERYRRTGQAEISRNDYAPKKEALRDRLMSAERASDGTRSSYENELSKRGVQYRANVSKPTEKNPHGKMNGYSYGEKDHRDAQGEQVWFKGSQLGRDHGWTATEKRLAERAAQTRTQDRDVPTRSEGKAAKPSRQSEFEPRSSTAHTHENLSHRRDTPGREEEGGKNAGRRADAPEQEPGSDVQQPRAAKEQPPTRSSAEAQQRTPDRPGERSVHKDGRRDREDAERKTIAPAKGTERRDNSTARKAMERQQAQPVSRAEIQERARREAAARRQGQPQQGRTQQSEQQRHTDRKDNPQMTNKESKQQTKEQVRERAQAEARDRERSREQERDRNKEQGRER